MLNVVIFSGGSGSVALQEGFSAIYGNETYNLDVIINAYDNGKSTGACRKVFNDCILGPSDLRKNHLTQLRLQKADELKDTSSRAACLYDLFSLRLTACGKEDYYAAVCKLLKKYSEAIGDETARALKSLLNCFFFEDAQATIWRRTLEDVQFKDFSVGNIFYSASACQNGYSLSLAGKDMARLFGIKDNVHLISDVNLYLEGRTESGHQVADEGIIVAWDNPQDKIASVVLLRDGQEYVPSVDEGVDPAKMRSCKSIIEEADLIIFSCGSQWSSLIPTYMHSGFRNMLSSSKAKKYIIMNNTEDHDMKGVSADKMMEILSRYIPVEDATAIVNLDAAQGMNKVAKVRAIEEHIGGIVGDSQKHNPVKLVSVIMKDFFGLADLKKTFVYDIDGTLWDERANSRGKAVGYENLNLLLPGIVLTGNTREHARDVFKYLYHQDLDLDIYSDFGNVHFTSKNYECDALTEKYAVDPNVRVELEKIEAFKGKIRVRGGGCVVTIKPLMNRHALLEKAKKALNVFGDAYEARISGHTSIDIMAKDYDKKAMLQEIMKKHGLNAANVVFIGNETEEGAEANIKDIGVQTIQVDDVYECNVLLRTLKCCASKKALNIPPQE